MIMPVLIRCNLLFYKIIKFQTPLDQTDQVFYWQTQRAGIEFLDIQDLKQFLSRDQESWFQKS